MYLSAAFLLQQQHWIVVQRSYSLQSLKYLQSSPLQTKSANHCYRVQPPWVRQRLDSTWGHSRALVFLLPYSVLLAPFEMFLEEFSLNKCPHFSVSASALRDPT